MTFQISKVSDAGSANPIVARLVPGLQDIISMAQLPKEKKDLVSECCYEMMKAQLEAEKAAKPLIEELRRIEFELVQNGVKTQNEGRVIEAPAALTIENSKVFLKFAKQSLQILAKALGIILDKEFKGPHFDRIKNRANELLGENHPLSQLLADDQDWIKEIIDLRNEDEHPKSGKEFVRGQYRITRAPDGTFVVNPPRFFNDALVLNRLEIYSHNLLTLSEEMIALGMETHFPPMAAIVEIPEEQRDPQVPIRFRLGLRQPIANQ